MRVILAVPSEAARFYRRALDAARKTEAGSVAEDDLADVTEALGEMLLRAGELDEATRIFAEARKMHDADPVGRARLLLREAYVAERVGRPDLVVRRARKIATELEGIDSAEATELRAQAAVSLAAARHLQGRAEESVRISLDAIREADSVDDRKARADAYVVMDWALLDLGRYDEATHLEEALEYYESIGDFNAAASVHNSMGALAYFQGRWEEAVGFYDRFIETKERLGDPVHAASGMLNVAEVLSDQGRWDEAEERLRVVLRVARGAKEENLAAYATAYLGRVLSRASQGGDGAALLEEASASFTAQRADREVEQVRGWQAEHAMLEGKWSEALPRPTNSWPMAPTAHWCSGSGGWGWGGWGHTMRPRRRCVSASITPRRKRPRSSERSPSSPGPSCSLRIPGSTSDAGAPRPCWRASAWSGSRSLLAREPGVSCPEVALGELQLPGVGPGLEQGHRLVGDAPELVAGTRIVARRQVRVGVVVGAVGLAELHGMWPEAVEVVDLGSRHRVLRRLLDPVDRHPER